MIVGLRKQAGGADGAGAEPADDPVRGPVGLRPPAVALAEHQLAVDALAGTSPSTRTPTSRIRARCSPRAS